MGKIYDDYFVKPAKRRLLVPAHVTETVTKTLERLRLESRKPGRPRKDDALTPAERQRARRARLKAKA